MRSLEQIYYDINKEEVIDEWLDTTTVHYDEPYKISKSSKVPQNEPYHIIENALDEYWLSPIEEHEGVLYKRDDLFQPFGAESVNGGKVRQAISLMRMNLKTIREKYNNNVITATSLHSPQGLIIGTVAKYFGINAVIGYGYMSNEETFYKNTIPTKVKALVGKDKIKILTNCTYTNVLNQKVGIFAEEENHFLIKFGINAIEYKASILDTISHQVQNIPEVDNLVIPVGSGTQNMIKPIF